eukprot:TRINITY_DN15170_c0_g2_i1.p1 TRINITY_DN15170_c0_g2~~TRINITY_DN15170_c0_g2_i1.p1  ORF type:complete len:519 (-),score=78.24 TRINITY_DN15170_c0_g2_i1:89-1606(-)
MVSCGSRPGTDGTTSSGVRSFLDSKAASGASPRGSVGASPRTTASAGTSGASGDDLLERLLRAAEQQRTEIRALQREVWMSAMGDPRLDNLERESDSQQSAITALQQECSACRVEVSALREYLEDSGIVCAERLLARLHRRRFAETLKAHPLPGLQAVTSRLQAALQAHGFLAIPHFLGRVTMREAGLACRDFHSAVHGGVGSVIGQLACGYIYVCGGTGDRIEALNSVESFSTVTRKWEVLPPMSCRRNDASALVVGGLLYVCGGCDGESSLNTVLNSVERFDPSRTIWEDMPPLLFARRGAAAGSVAGKLYICGGYDSTEGALDFSESFDPSSSAVWEALPLMRGQRAEPAAAVLDRKLYVCGGREGDGSWAQLNTAERFDPETGTWQDVPSMLEQRSGAAAAAVGGALYVCGGMGPKDPRSVECFRPIVGSWETMPPMKVARYYAAAAATSRVFLVFGGCRDLQYLDAVEQFEPSHIGGGTWTSVAPMSEKRVAPAAAFAPL